MWCWMIKNKKLLDSFATMTLGEAIKPIKKNIIAIETNETTFWLSYFDFSNNHYITGLLPCTSTYCTVRVRAGHIAL